MFDLAFLCTSRRFRCSPAQACLNELLLANKNGLRRALQSRARGPETQLAAIAPAFPVWPGDDACGWSKSPSAACMARNRGN